MDSEVLKLVFQALDRELDARNAPEAEREIAYELVRQMMARVELSPEDEAEAAAMLTRH